MTNETVTVKCSDQELLTEALSHTDAQILHADQNGLTVAKLSAEEVGRVAFDEGLIVFEPGTNRGAGTPLNGPEPMRVVVGFVASTAP